MKTCKKKALLLSGGMDSIACSFMNIAQDADLIYFSYGQVYDTLEYPFAQKRASDMNKELIVIKKNWHTDITNRNYYFISELKRIGYNEVIVGSRNILPLFDKYKDSNWLNLKLYQYLFRIKVRMPLTGFFKFMVKRKLKNYTDYYSTENVLHKEKA